MKPSELKYNVQKTGSPFFNKSTLHFFEDTMANYGCHSDNVNGTPVWVLTRKRPVRHGRQDPAYFCKDTFEVIHKDQT